MQATRAASHIPAGYGTVTPFVVVKGAAEFIDFTGRAFGAEELARVMVDGVIGHAEVKIGNSIVMLFDSKPDWPWTPAFLRLYVPDTDAAFERALAAGAESVSRPGDLPWGDRGSRVRDPFGNLWWIMTRMEELTEEELGRRWSDPHYLAALDEHQNAEFFPRRS
jgi:PhnB protein